MESIVDLNHWKMKLGSYLQQETELNWPQSPLRAFLNLWLALMCSYSDQQMTGTYLVVLWSLYLLANPTCITFYCQPPFQLLATFSIPWWKVKTHIRRLLIKAFVLMDLGIVYFFRDHLHMRYQSFLPRDAILCTLTYNIPNCAQACILKNLTQLSTTLKVLLYAINLAASFYVFLLRGFCGWLSFILGKWIELHSVYVVDKVYMMYTFEDRTNPFIENTMAK